MTVCCGVCGKSGGPNSLRGLTKLARAGWALVSQGYPYAECPTCTREVDANKFGMLPEWVTVKRMPGFDHYDVTVRIEHADAVMVGKVLAAVRRMKR